MQHIILSWKLIYMYLIIFYINNLLTFVNVIIYIFFMEWNAHTNSCIKSIILFKKTKLSFTNSLHVHEKIINTRIQILFNFYSKKFFLILRGKKFLLHSIKLCEIYILFRNQEKKIIEKKVEEMLNKKVTSWAYATRETLLESLQ